MSELDINRINIMMGSKCNFNCRHCIQTDAMNFENPNNIHEQVFVYIEHLVNIRPSFKQKLSLMFWGGEPLLYMGVIDQFVQRLGDKVQYGVVTNGSLLTNKLVDYFNANKFNVVLSNDGVNTNHVRPFNMLDNDNFIRLFNKLDNRAIDACITAYNQDYYVLWDYIESKLGKDIWINHEMLECTWDMPEDLYNFDFDAYKKTMQRIVADARKAVVNRKANRPLMLLEQMVKRIAKIVEKKEIGLRCSQMQSMISIDLAGNVYACHNGCGLLGTVNDEFEKLYTNFSLHFRKKDNSDCNACPYLAICGYGCLNSMPSKGKDACCKLKKIFFNACLDFIRLTETTFEEVDMEDSYDCN